MADASETSDTSNTFTLQGVGASSVPGSMPAQEDRYTILLPDEFSGHTDSLAFFAIYDGHASDKVAEHASKNIRRLLISSGELRQGNYESAIERAIQAEEEELLQGFWAGEELFAVAGSTAALVVVNLTRGILVVANLGDSHVLLGEADGEDHTSLKVRHRIESAGGTLNTDGGVPRVGGLNMSRALGDLQYKSPLKDIGEQSLSSGQEKAGIEPTKKGDLVSSYPSLKRYPLQSDRRYFLALITDGVTNTMDDETIMHQIARSKQDGMDADKVAAKITEKASGVPDSDNATCVTTLLFILLCRMFESVVSPPQVRGRVPRVQPAPRPVAATNIIDIRSDKAETQLRQSLEASIHAACHGEAAMPELLLWDEQGLRYFEDVTYAPSYYLTNEEIGLLEKHKYQIAQHIPSGSMLVELGSGNLRKIKILLDALDELGREVDYFALDVSYQELHRTLSIVPPGTFRHVRCFGLLGTYDDGHNWMQLPEIRSRSKTILSLGSTLGSFQRPEAADFLASFVTPENNSSLLIGLDGCKDADRVLAAYNDSEGFNRRFIKHGLERANEILGPDTFDLDKWDVIGRWDAAHGSHNQYYVPSDEVSLTGETIPAGRSILAIKSHKYDADDRDALCRRADLAVSDAWASKNQYNLLYLEKP
ncbi:uncharacterized protein BO96DRAFT_435407 [Aspergillus niger CBS 101883]|uniref:PPM-type phosphatase domain-containing protein n=3 Tax=Aspergillus niger TaxID=5061 RepID=A0A370C0Y3_ASPNG|nr:uncharacterized protein BO96DRAFT_435407 [Aspergillus niger CBS 101883]PYH55057.1 hypothetical protein BO96DRAFT_435407 [Aspergillus niger CBS 101883]RDH19479.1 hypothetical protein M747DRAFT_315661 [Aspergillus niger ATCC 13496]